MAMTFQGTNLYQQYGGGIPSLVPQQANALNTTVTGPTYGQDVFQMTPNYTVASDFIGQLVWNLLVKNYEEILGRVFPVTIDPYPGKLKSWSTIDFGQTQASPIADGAPAREFSITYQQEQATWKTDGLSFRYSNHWLVYPEGKRQFAQCLVHLASCIYSRVTNEALLVARDTYNKIKHNLVTSPGTYSRSMTENFLHILKTEVDCWAAAQVPDAVRRLELASNQRLSIIGGIVDTMVVTPTTLALLSSIHAINTVWAQGGPTAAAVIASGPSSLRRFGDAGNVVVVAPDYGKENFKTNPLTIRTEIGEFTPFECISRGSLGDGTEKWSSKLMNVAMNDSDSGSMKPVSFIDVVRNSGRYDQATGEPKTVERLSGVIPAGKQDLFEWTKSPTSAPTVVRYFGNFQHTNLGDFQDMVGTFLSQFCDTNQFSREEVLRQIAEGNEILTQLESVQYYNGFFKRLYEANKKRVATIPESQATELGLPFGTWYSPNLNGSLDLPSIIPGTGTEATEIEGEAEKDDLYYNAMLEKIPPGYANWAGFQQIASEVNKGSWKSKGYDEDFGKRVSAWVKFFKSIVNALKVICPNHPFLEPKNLPPHVFERTHYSAAFSNMVQPRQRFPLWMFSETGPSAPSFIRAETRVHATVGNLSGGGFTTANVNTYFEGKYAQELLSAAQLVKGTILDGAPTMKTFVRDYSASGADSSQLLNQMVKLMMIVTILTKFYSVTKFRGHVPKVVEVLESLKGSSLQYDKPDSAFDIERFLEDLRERFAVEKISLPSKSLINDLAGKYDAVIEEFRAASTRSTPFVAEIPVVENTGFGSSLLITPLTWTPDLVDSMVQYYKGIDQANIVESDGKHITVFPSSQWTPFSPLGINILKAYSDPAKRSSLFTEPSRGVDVYAPALIQTPIGPRSQATIPMISGGRHVGHVNEQEATVSPRTFTSAAVVHHMSQSSPSVRLVGNRATKQQQPNNTQKIGVQASLSTNLSEVFSRRNKLSRRGNTSVSSARINNLPTSSNFSGHESDSQNLSQLSGQSNFARFEYTEDDSNLNEAMEDFHLRRLLYDFFNNSVSASFKLLGTFFMFCTNNLRTIEEFYNANIPPPFDGLAHRPWMTYEGDMAFNAMSGGQTGQTFAQPTQISQSTDNQHRETSVAATQMYICVVPNTKNISHLPNVSIVRNVYGTNVKFCDPLVNTRNLAEYKRNGCSIIASLIPPQRDGFSLGKTIDITGEAVWKTKNGLITIPSNNEVNFYYPGSEFVAQTWGFTPNYRSYPLSTSKTNTPDPSSWYDVNTIEHRATYWRASIDPGSKAIVYNESNKVTGSGHWKDKTGNNVTDKQTSSYLALNTLKTPWG